MAKIEKFEDIVAWQKALELCDLVYLHTNTGTFSKASAGEIRAQLYIAKNQHYISIEDFILLNDKVIEVSKIISGFISYLRTVKKSKESAHKNKELS